MNTQPPPPISSVLFARGILARLEIWPILKVAVQEAWGGPESVQKRSWIASVLVDAFEETNPPPDDQYIEEMLLQIMSDEFDVTIEDGSGEGVARDLVKLWEDTRDGKAADVENFEALAEKARGKKVDVNIQRQDNDEENWEDDDGDDDDDEEEGDEEEVPQLIQSTRTREETEVDEDGFTLVKSKRR
ncbi:hypothetical protein FA15DRAFT_671069 [Coprinopsis marcescibilis]|uniref:Pre-rRNA-processing protein TSR2 n=1 Tax=Coprinopsis marcescibilis TaxID=230819 RepID=A0A5C3KRS6_COPMA|nr:hypothetical protein FA15DRAFT_671069 [Coprinopsis marcescibilis]